MILQQCCFLFLYIKVFKRHKSSRRLNHVVNEPIIIHKTNQSPVKYSYILDSTDPSTSQQQWPRETQHMCDPLFMCHIQGNAVSSPASCPHWGRVSVLRLWAPPTSACNCHGNQHHLSVTWTRASSSHTNRKWWVHTTYPWLSLFSKSHTALLYSKQKNKKTIRMT